MPQLLPLEKDFDKNTESRNGPRSDLLQTSYIVEDLQAKKEDYAYDQYHNTQINEGLPLPFTQNQDIKYEGGVSADHSPKLGAVVDYSPGIKCQADDKTNFI